MSDDNVYSGMNFDPYTGERLTPQEEKPAEAAQEVTSVPEKPEEKVEVVAEAELVVTPASEEPAAEQEDLLTKTMRELKEEEKVQKKARKTKKERSEKKGGGFFRKALAAAVLAVIFGAAAGGTFYGICKYTGLLKNMEGQTTIASNQIAEDQAKQLPALKAELTEKSEGEVKLVNSDNIQVISTDVSDMVEQVIPAMVTIVNTGKDAYDFWGRTYASQSSGTGVIIGENETELLIVTNHHVAKDAKQLDITFIDDVTVQAKVKGMDSDMDLAVLAVSLEDIPEETKNAIVIAQLGDSDSLKLGQPAVVIGNALGIGISVTDGIISGLNREMTTEDGKTGTFIQTDAAVNHGNSGGALLNIKGEVIGIVSNKIDGESVEGMGYAIPISAASPIIAELIQRQTRTDVVNAEEQGYLGVRLQSVTAEAREYYDLPEGGYVYYVSEGSGAQKAGIQKGDVITKIEKMSVTSNAEAREILQYYKQGEEVLVTYSRMENGEYVSHEVTVVLGAPEMN